MMDEREDGSEAALANRAEQAPGLFASQNDRQRVVAPDLKLLPELPLALKELLVEQAQSDDRLIERRGSQLLLVAPEDQVIEDLSLSQLLERALRVVLGQLSHLAQILRLGAAPERFAFDEYDVVLVDFGCVIHRGPA